jgi:hypothetical protein
MKFTRRGFLKAVGGTALVAVSAPLYIPAQNLAFGVPHQILTATEMPTKPLSFFVSGEMGLLDTTRIVWKNKFLNAAEIASILPVPEFMLEDLNYDLWS